ncbi:putative chromatin remodeling & transcription regulator BTB-POZ family [Helianthus annuus]|nr:putative chromatin remodeling & transcription regulator BTB-POZ family [Helianthus annuus]
MASDMPESSKRQAWFCTTGLPSDVVVDVGDMTFHLHKFPLMAKSKKLHEMITEQEKNDTAESVSENSKNEDIREETDTEHAHITLPDFPGGSETFEAAVKSCYSVKIELTPLNVAPLRCAGEVLEMTEEYCEDNLISKTEWFLSQTMFKSLKNSIKTLKSCEDLLPVKIFFLWKKKKERSRRERKR